MREEWTRNIKSIIDVCEVIAGQSPESKFYNKEGEGLPFYQGKKEFTDKFIGRPTTWTNKVTKEALKNDILISVRAPVGPINVATEKICIGRGLAAIRASEKIDNDYLFYFLLKHEAEIESNVGAVFNSINKTQIGKIKIPVPPLPEQKQIVKLLDQAFEAIDQAKANIEKNIANAKELFQSKLNEVFSQKGEGWEEKSLGEVCLKTTNIKWQDNKDIELKYIDLSSVSRESLEVIESSTVNNETAPSRAKKIVEKGDVIFATTRPTLKRATIIDEKFDGQICSTGYVVLRPNNEIKSEWIFFYLLTSTFMERMESLQRGASYPAVTDTDVKGSLLSIPKQSSMQNEYIEMMINLRQGTNELIYQYHMKLTSLEELKKSILQKAFSGELTNPN